MSNHQNHWETVDVSLKMEAGGAAELLIDGVDVSHLVLSDGLAVDFGPCKCCGMFEPMITVKLPIRKLMLDLPDSLVRFSALYNGEPVQLQASEAV